MKLLKIKKLFICLFSAVIVAGFGLVNSSYSSQGKPLLVEVSTSWCFACKLLKPTIEQLKSEYGSQVEFVLLDASNEETIKGAQLIAEEYGITDFFNKNKNAFPTVSIISPLGNVEKIILGAHDKIAYSEVLNNLLGITPIASNEKNEKEEESNPEGRPETPVISERPPLPNILDRSLETLSSGRPPELTFWSVGQQIPTSAYFNYLVLPKCSANNNILCSNITTPFNKAQDKQDVPVFKPWTANATRDEKGLKLP